MTPKVRVTEHVNHIEVVVSKLFQRWYELELDILNQAKTHCFLKLHEMRFRAEKDTIASGGTTIVTTICQIDAWKPLIGKDDAGCKGEASLRETLITNNL